MSADSTGWIQGCSYQLVRLYREQVSRSSRTGGPRRHRRLWKLGHSVDTPRGANLDEEGSDGGVGWDWPLVGHTLHGLHVCVLPSRAGDRRLNEGLFHRRAPEGDGEEGGVRCFPRLLGARERW